MCGNQEKKDSQERNLKYQEKSAKTEFNAYKKVRKNSLSVLPFLLSSPHTPPPLVTETKLLLYFIYTFIQIHFAYFAVRISLRKFPMARKSKSVVHTFSFPTARQSKSVLYCTPSFPRPGRASQCCTVLHLSHGQAEQVSVVLLLPHGQAERQCLGVDSA